jgi:hypothetical protein
MPYIGGRKKASVPKERIEEFLLSIRFLWKKKFLSEEVIYEIKK